MRKQLHISSGCFGSVTLYRSESHGDVVVKRMFSHFEPHQLREFENNKRLFLSSPDNFLEPFESFFDNEHLCIVTRYFDSTKLDVTKIKDKEKVAKKLCSIFSVLNKEKIFYTDLHNGNILVGKDEDVFLVDFDCGPFSEAEYYQGEMWIDPPEYRGDRDLTLYEAEKYQIWNLGLLLTRIFYGLERISRLPQDVAQNPILAATLATDPEKRHIPF
ncbi:hypothetical protein GMAR_ORF9 [Golden Marseillevirus]|uniref:hypothetical protein n=1 Tax=Golden Marseillevirus TaxID=1720526 RepID=UPI000877ABA8|nr:hypothetical protein GMAR_ORF9 [Golden Marseillevirus]ALX27384.1 hypothetical protein GMAR_ORF9 [Golden Marseillevirus]